MDNQNTKTESFSKTESLAKTESFVKKHKKKNNRRYDINYNYHKFYYILQ